MQCITNDMLNTLVEINKYSIINNNITIDIEYKVT